MTGFTFNFVVYIFCICLTIFTLNARTKRMIVDVIACQPGENLVVVLDSPCSQQQEEVHQAMVKKRDLIDRKLAQSQKEGKKLVRHASILGDTRLFFTHILSSHFWFAEFSLFLWLNWVFELLYTHTLYGVAVERILQYCIKWLTFVILNMASLVTKSKEPFPTPWGIFGIWC